jgi:hypothetical protein
MTINLRAAVLIVSSFIVAAAPASAQSVTDVLTFLVTNQSVSTGSVERDREAAQATSVTISRALAASLATLPVTSSSSAFVYRLNPELGTVERATQSFGPFFTDRASSAGRYQASFGLTLQHLHFTSLDGRDLLDGSLVTTANKFSDETEAFDVDQLTLRVNASVATLYANVGITDRLDVGVAVPFVALTLDGSRVNTYRGRTFTQASANARAIGLADVDVRTKYVLVSKPNAGFATLVNLRLPTGREDDLLGAGSTSLKLSAIGSVEQGRFSAHANTGVSVGGLARELSYGGAVAIAASDRVSVVGELLGRWIDSPGHIVQVSAPHPLLSGVETLRLTPDASSLQLLTLVPGVKWNLTDTWVLAANVSIPLTSGGLTAPFTPFVGLDYALGK